jgi:hypothetical protein
VSACRVVFLVVTDVQVVDYKNGYPIPVQQRIRGNLSRRQMYSIIQTLAA